MRMSVNSSQKDKICFTEKMRLRKNGSGRYLITGVQLSPADYGGILFSFAVKTW